MNELIKLNEVKINDELVQAVSARELYEALGLDKSHWSRWTKKNILNNQFAVENSDYVGFAIVANGNETTDYALVIDFAKKLAMQVKTMQGEQVRNYFIECEKQLYKLVKPQPARIIGATEDKLNTIILALQHTSLSDIAKETYIITSAETLTGVYLGYRPQVEQVTYSAKEVGDMLGISANLVGRIANAHGLKTEEYGLYYLSKSQHSDKQVEHFRYFESAIDKFKAILGDE